MPNQADSTSERIKAGQDRAKVEDKPTGPPPALALVHLIEYKRMFTENPPVSRVARIMKISWSMTTKAIFEEKVAQGENHFEMLAIPRRASPRRGLRLPARPSEDHLLRGPADHDGQPVAGDLRPDGGLGIGRP